nr:pre-mRNA-splicing factor ATP-dependent RNA helicase DEAH7 [Tanacetum cinerariifolium]
MDINKMTHMLEPEETGIGRMQLSGKDRVVFRASERKSLLGDKIKAESTVIQVEEKCLIQIVKPLTNDLLDMLLPRMLSKWSSVMSHNPVTRCKAKFLSKYCPPAGSAKKIKEINSIQQEPDETLYQAWERFKNSL